MIKAIHQCRVCGNPRLEPVLDLGEQMLTGVFPATPHAKITAGPLRLVKCFGDSPDVCGLLQMAHSYDLSEMYGENYGYRSGLNPTMVAHLTGKIARIVGKAPLAPGDLVIDIGSNDGTSLGAYPWRDLRFVGVDPTGIKFREFYPGDVELIPEFFSAGLIHERFGGQKAKVVTSFSMFYDLESPLEFMREVHDVLDDDGVWALEQSYMPTMLERNSYDTACHEHLEFYGLGQIKWMADKVGFEIADLEFNDVNGGSFSVLLRKGRGEAIPAARRILARESAEGLDTLAPYRAFAERVSASRDELRRFVEGARAEGKRVAGLGASTKGNVLLQYCGFTPEEIFAVGEVNPDKFGCYTPGTWIPIVSQSELMSLRPDYLIVLPWHFRPFFEGSPAFAGTSLVFPLPQLSIVRGRG
jgi:NDP-4-keto-2,6-dideoxyhexose 3-C-methyltransferase